jgi:hypothetical protein
VLRIARVIKSRVMRWVGHIGHGEEGGEEMHARV